MTARPLDGWQGLPHRRDIDGLRAVAVLPILLFHAGMPGSSGGYVGVDIFFVLSGFLLTGIIRADLAAGRFSLAGFYARRARRILPALVAVLAAVSLAGVLVLLPYDLVRYGRSLVASASFTANLYFWLTSGYFELSAATQPLLHLWSLAVEEQFYLVYPLLLLLLARQPRLRLALLLLAIAAVSIAEAEAGVRAGDKAAFFLPAGRIWEFLAGAIVSLGVLPAARPGRLAEALAALAAVTIAATVMLYTAATPFPGLAALPPVLATALLLHLGGAETRVHRLLGTAPLVAIGLISYSLYLWHWPIIALWRYRSLGELGPGGAAFCLALTFVLSVASWRLVEQPFRAAWFSAPRRVLPASLAAMLVLVGLGVALDRGRGFPGRLPDAVRMLEAGRSDVHPRRAECLQVSGSPVAAGRGCRFGAAGAPVRIAVIGDSFGNALFVDFDAAATARGVGGMMWAREGCDALLDINSGNPRCRAMMRQSVAEALALPDVDTVVLASRWTAAAESARFGVDAWEHVNTDDATVTPSRADARRVFRDGLRRMIDAFPGKRVVLVYGIPEQDVIVPREAALNLLVGRDAPIAVPASRYRQRQAFVGATMAALAAETGAVLVDLGDALCPGEDLCRITADGRALYSDDNHLSVFGARVVYDAIARGMAAAPTPISAAPR